MGTIPVKISEHEKIPLKIKENSDKLNLGFNTKGIIIKPITITENGTEDVTEYASVNVAVPSSDFVITLSNDENVETWVPDKTFSEINNAWKKVTGAYKKVNGTWVSQSIESLFNSNTNYKKGN